MKTLSEHYNEVDKLRSEVYKKEESIKAFQHVIDISIEEVNQLKRAIERYEHQIYRAEKENKTSFSRDRYLPLSELIMK